MLASSAAAGSSLRSRSNASWVDRRQRPRIRQPPTLASTCAGPGPPAAPGTPRRPCRSRPCTRRPGPRASGRSPSCRRQPVRIRLGQPGHPALQDRHRLRPGQHVDLDRHRDLRPAALREVISTCPPPPGSHVARCPAEPRRCRIPAATGPAPAARPAPRPATACQRRPGSAQPSAAASAANCSPISPACSAVTHHTRS